MNKVNLNDIKAAVTFKDGKVNVKPFDIKYQDMKVTVAGTHGFDQLMNYNLKFDVPAKYLGSDINNLISKLTPANAAKLDNIPINAILGGSFSQPKISTDIKAATTTLVNNLAKQQKEQLIGKGTSALENLINKNKKPADTSTTKTPVKKEEIKTKAKDLLNGILKKKEKPATTTTP
jgi:hypothetical protein